MKFSRIICGAALVVVGSLVLVSAGQYGGGHNQNNGALTHYGGGGCHGGQGCYNGAQAPARTSQNQYGPYHSYAVRPAVYGGYGLYTYKGYARHQPKPAAHYRRPRSYGMAAPSRQQGGSNNYGGCSGYNCGGSRHHGGANHMANYAMRPVKALALVQNNYNHAKPAYHPQQQQRQYGAGGHYRATRGAYGGSHNRPSHHQKQHQPRHYNMQRHYKQQRHQNTQNHYKQQQHHYKQQNHYDQQHYRPQQHHQQHHQQHLQQPYGGGRASSHYGAASNNGGHSNSYGKSQHSGNGGY